MKIQKIRSVKTPERGTKLSAGIDFFVPDDFKPDTWVSPNRAINIPSGIIAEVPPGYALIAFNKSGIALKGFQIGACVIDEDYIGEIHLHVINIQSHELEIKPGQKLAQFILIPVFLDSIEIVEKLENRVTERGTGAFGSTNKL